MKAHERQRLSHLDTSMTAQVEVKLCRMRDPHVNSRACRNVARPSDLVLAIGTEESSVVAFLDHDKRDSRLVVALQLHAGFTNRSQLMG